jgi:hypothetical protein
MKAHTFVVARWPVAHGWRRFSVLPRRTSATRSINSSRNSSQSVGPERFPCAFPGSAQEEFKFDVDVEFEFNQEVKGDDRFESDQRVENDEDSVM